MCEFPPTVVQIKPVRLATLGTNDSSVVEPGSQAVLLPEPWHDLEVVAHSLHDFVEGAFLRWEEIQGARYFIVRDVQVEVAIAIHICQRSRGAATLRGQAGSVSDFREPSPAVVEEETVRSTERSHHQVEIAIAVDVDERSTNRATTFQSETALAGDVLELPIAKVLVEPARSTHSRQKNIRATVAIDVAKRYPGSKGEFAVLEQRIFGYAVNKSDSRIRGGQLCESTSLRFGYFELTPAIAMLVMPGDWYGRRSRTADHENRQSTHQIASSHDRVLTNELAIAAPR